jgi:hypothetical protein
MTISRNRHSRRKAASRARKGRTVKALSAATLKAEADRVLSRTQLAALTETAHPMRSDDAAELGRCIAELASAIAVLPEGSAEHRLLVAEHIAMVNGLLNGVRYYTTVQHRIDYLVVAEPGPTWPAQPNDTSSGADRWRSAEARYYEQTAIAYGLTEACAPVLGRTRANGFAMELLHLRNGDPVRMLLPAQKRAAARDSLHRDALKRMAVQRQVFDAAVENVPRAEILRRANGPGGADLIADKTFENWIAVADGRDNAVAEQLGLAWRNGIVALLPPALQIRLLHLLEMTFSEWVRLVLKAR